jgi:cytochrome c biogenesis protein CcmG/thiol:disulfide interchange protein DsbE
MSRFILPVVGFALLVVFFWIGLGRDPTLVPSPLVGKPAPSFSLAQLNNPELKLTDTAFQGQVSLLNVWATWCVGCRQEHETLLQIAREGGVPIFGLNWKDDSKSAVRWLEQLGNPYTATGVDADGRVAIDWGVYGAPETFLIDANGIVLYKHIAPLTMSVWEQEFVPRIRRARGEKG